MSATALQQSIRFLVSPMINRVIVIKAQKSQQTSKESIGVQRKVSRSAGRRRNRKRRDHQTDPQGAGKVLAGIFMYNKSKYNRQPTSTDGARRIPHCSFPRRYTSVSHRSHTSREPARADTITARDNGQGVKRSGRQFGCTVRRNPAGEVIIR